MEILGLSEISLVMGMVDLVVVIKKLGNLHCNMNLALLLDVI